MSFVSIISEMHLIMLTMVVHTGGRERERIMVIES